MKPKFPLRVTYTDEFGNIETDDSGLPDPDAVMVIHTEMELYTELEVFQSGRDGFVTDADGRPVNLKVDILNKDNAVYEVAEEGER